MAGPFIHSDDDATVEVHREDDHVTVEITNHREGEDTCAYVTMMTDQAWELVDALVVQIRELRFER